MEFVIKCLFLGGQYATQAAGEVIVTIIKGGMTLHKNLTQRYESMVRIIETHENMLEHLNAFNQNTDYDRVDHLRLASETGNCEITRANSDILNNLQSYSILQKPSLSKCMDIVKNHHQNLSSSLSNDGFHDHEEIYTDRYKHLYRNFKGTSTGKEENSSGATKTKNSRENITSPEGLHKPKQLEQTDSRKTFSQQNFLTSSIQFLSYQMLSLKSTKKEPVNEPYNLEASAHVEKLLKEEIDHPENPLPDGDQFFDCETDESFFESSASISPELKKQSVLNDDEPIGMDEKFSKRTRNAPCVPEGLPKLNRIEDKSKLTTLTNEEESVLGIKTNKADVSQRAQELAPLGVPISPTIQFDDPTQFEDALQTSSVNQSSSSPNTNILDQSANDEAKNLNEQPPPLQYLPKPKFLQIFNDAPPVLKVTQANLKENTALDGLPSSLEKNGKELPRSLKLNDSLEDNEVDGASADSNAHDFFIITEESKEDFDKLKKMQQLTTNPVVTSVTAESGEAKMEDDDFVQAIPSEGQRKNNEDSLSKPHSHSADSLLKVSADQNVFEESSTTKITNPKEFSNTRSHEDEFSQVLKVAKAEINVEENSALDDLTLSSENNEKESPRSFELSDSFKDNENDEGPADSNKSEEDSNKLKEMQLLTRNSILLTPEASETGEVSIEDDNLMQAKSKEEERQSNEGRTVGSLSKSYSLRDDSFSNASEENLATIITNPKDFESAQLKKDKLSPVIKVAKAEINAKDNAELDGLPPPSGKNEKEPPKSLESNGLVEDNENDEARADTFCTTTDESRRGKEDFKKLKEMQELTSNYVLTEAIKTGEVNMEDDKIMQANEEEGKSNEDRIVDSLSKSHSLRNDSFSIVSEESLVTKILNPTEFRNTQSNKDEFSPVLKVAKAETNAEDNAELDGLPPSSEKNEKEPPRSLKSNGSLGDNENDEALLADTFFETTTEENIIGKKDFNKLEEMQLLTSNCVLTPEATKTGEVNMEDDKMQAESNDEEKGKSNEDRIVGNLSKPHSLRGESFSNISEENLTAKITDPKELRNTNSNNDEISATLKVAKATINADDNAVLDCLRPTLEKNEKELAMSLESNGSHKESENDEALANTLFIKIKECSRGKKDFNKLEEMKQVTSNPVLTPEATKTGEVNMEDDKIMQANEEEGKSNKDRTVDSLSKPHSLRDDSFSNVREENSTTKISNPNKFENIQSNKDEFSPVVKQDAKDNAAFVDLPPTLEKSGEEPRRSLGLNDSLEDHENEKELADSNVQNALITTEEDNRFKEDFDKLEETQQPTNNSLTDKVSTGDDNIIQAMSSKKQRRQNNVDGSSKPHLLCDSSFSKLSEETLATKIRNTRKFENILDSSDDIYVLPDISSTRFPNKDVYKEETSGRAMLLMEEEEGAQSIENVKSPATFPNVAQDLMPFLGDKKTEIPKFVQITYLTKPHFFRCEILSTNKKENESKSSSSSEAKNQTRELHDTSWVIQKGGQLSKLQRDAFKSLTIKEFHLHKSFANEFLYTTRFDEILNDRLNQIAPKQALKDTHGNTEIDNLTDPPRYNEFLTNYTNFLLRSKSNNFLKDYFVEYAQNNYLQSSILYYTTFARTMKENLANERRRTMNNRGNENQLFKKEMHDISKRGDPNIPAESGTKSSTPNNFSKEQAPVTFSLILHENNKHEKPLSMKTKNFELCKNITPENCTEMVHADESKLRTLKLPPTKHELYHQKFSNNQQQLVKENRGQHHKKSIRRTINHIRHTQTMHTREEIVPNLKSGLQKVYCFGIKKLSKVNRPKEIKKQLAPYLKNETKLMIANQKAFYKLEQKVTQYLIQLNMRVLNKNKYVNEISLEKTFKRGFAKSPPAAENDDDDESEKCEEENGDDKLAGRSILYIFFMAFLNFATEQELPFP